MEIKEWISGFIGDGLLDFEGCTMQTKMGVIIIIVCFGQKNMQHRPSSCLHISFCVSYFLISEFTSVIPFLLHGYPTCTFPSRGCPTFQFLSNILCQDSSVFLSFFRYLCLHSFSPLSFPNSTHSILHLYTSAFFKHMQKKSVNNSPSEELQTYTSVGVRCCRNCRVSPECIFLVFCQIL